MHDIQIARSVFSINKKFNLPIILDLHENRPEIMKYYAHVNSILGKLLIHASQWKKYEYKYIKAAQKVIVITEEAKEYYDLDIINAPKRDFYDALRGEVFICSRLGHGSKRLKRTCI